MQHWNDGQVRWDGDSWLFEGGRPAGSMRFRLRVGTVSGASAATTGTFSANSLDAGWSPVFAPTGVRGDTDGATFQGDLAAGSGLTGRLTGTLAFVGPDGTRATCSEVWLQMLSDLP